MLQNVVKYFLQKSKLSGNKYMENSNSYRSFKSPNCFQGSFLHSQKDTMRKTNMSASASLSCLSSPVYTLILAQTSSFPSYVNKPPTSESQKEQLENYLMLHLVYGSAQGNCKLSKRTHLPKKSKKGVYWQFNSLHGDSLTKNRTKVAANEFYAGQSYIAYLAPLTPMHFQTRKF